MSKPSRPSTKRSRDSSPNRADAPGESEPRKSGDSRGIEVRRAVLGDAHVDRAIESRTDLTREFDDLITRYAWGEIWTREGLPRDTRSLLTIGMLVALNRMEELRMHLRGAVNNGVSRDEIKEVLLQSAIYCGVPAANSAFRIARDFFVELDRETDGSH
jgi:4-carboxymuconolactone decarboxylase